MIQLEYHNFLAFLFTIAYFKFQKALSNFFFPIQHIYHKPLIYIRQAISLPYVYQRFMVNVLYREEEVRQSLLEFKICYGKKESQEIVVLKLDHSLLKSHHVVTYNN